MRTNAPKPKRCKQCGKEFVPLRSTAIACSYPCAKAWVDARNLKLKAQKAKQEAKIERQITKERKEAIKTLAEWKKDLQTWTNKLARLRDADLPCISCGRFHQGQWHGGHYQTVGAHPELRFDLRNIHKQCAPCNNHLHGNIVNYRKGLIQRYGVEYVEWLEGPHEPLHANIDWCKAQIQEVKKMIQNLKSSKL